ncbi:g421 [Yersinia phage fHe-Yen9-04]|uniref:G421 protein n=1 Tax=Yersinia phage fHe-Yen9-04 TaxID=2052742 RepID=A0A2C9CZ96_9CAUD|nr:hypothetical protein FDJ41_gp482 [Yersinia phage fHe-Yen9-04]SOK58698.1 g421 [Yersinia phage fHe-Yen9-04]VUE36467.1 g421 [Yersinia phage fHe-Yen9-04]
MILTLIFLWSLLNGISCWTMAIMAILTSEYQIFFNKAGNGFLYTLICIDSYLRIFSNTHTGLW